MPMLARHRWDVTRQHRDETVRDFANYMVMLEEDFSTPVPMYVLVRLTRYVSSIHRGQGEIDVSLLRQSFSYQKQITV